MRQKLTGTISTYHKNGSTYGSLKQIWDERQLILLMLPALVFLLIFNYIPMYGILIAFQKYRMGAPFLAFDGSVEWVGFDNFAKLFTSLYFPRALKNTLVLSIGKLLCGFWVPIVFALLLNEIRSKYYKKITQTLSYLPHFISVVVIVGIVQSILSTNGGLINNVISVFGGESIEFLNNSAYFPAIYILLSIWHTFGWSAIIYLASISSINPNLYEAAIIDGANRFKQAIYITIPGIMPTVSILLILDMGRIMVSDVEKILLLYNPAIYDTADVLGTYSIRSGIFEHNYSLATAVGFFTAVVNFMLLKFANTATNKLNGYGLW